MVRKLNKAKKPEGSLVSRQKAKLEDQRTERRRQQFANERARTTANAEKYDREKSAREEKGGKGYGGPLSSHRMTGSRGHGSDYEVNPRISYRHNEEYLIDYLLDEGFASDERSAESIMGAMSEAWVESIFEDVGED